MRKVEAAKVWDIFWLSQNCQKTSGEQTSFLVQLFENHQSASKDAVAELAKHLIGIQTAGATGKGGARRL